MPPETHHPAPGSTTSKLPAGWKLIKGRNMLNPRIKDGSALGVQRRAQNEAQRKALDLADKFEKVWARHPPEKAAVDHVLTRIEQTVRAEFESEELDQLFRQIRAEPHTQTHALDALDRLRDVVSDICTTTGPG